MNTVTDEAVTLWARFVAIFGKIILFLWVFVAPIFGILVTVGMFIFLDTFIGIWKAKKLKQPVTSRKMGRIINKMLLYNSVVITFFALDHFIFHDIVIQFFSIDYALTKVIAVVLISIEAYSIDESFQQATGKGLFERAKDLIKKYKDVNEDLPKENEDS